MPIRIHGSMSAPSQHYKTWRYVNSPRTPDGKLLLRSNATSKQERMCGPYNANWGQPGLTAMTSGLDVDFGTTPRSRAAYAQAYDRFRDKAWSSAQASLLVDLAERNQTLRMVGGTLSRILKGAIAVKRLQFGKAVKILALGDAPRGLVKSRTFEAFQNNWLAYRYGWLPLASSAESLLKASLAPLPSGYGVRSSGSFVERDVVVTSDSYVRHTIVFRKTRCVVKGKVAVANRDLANLNQYGLLNVANVAWELVPFSFVIDWFTNIGNVIEDLTSFTGLSLTDVSITYHESVDQHYRQLRANGIGSPAGYTNFGYGVSKQRSLANGLHRPVRAFFHNGLNTKRIVDAVALSGLVFNKRR